MYAFLALCQVFCNEGGVVDEMNQKFVEDEELQSCYL
jgi:hypothetical protein